MEGKLHLILYFRTVCVFFFNSDPQLVFCFEWLKFKPQKSFCCTLKQSTHTHTVQHPLSSPVQSNQNLQYVLLTPLQNEGRYYTNSKKNLFARASLFLFLDQYYRWQFIFRDVTHFRCLFFAVLCILECIIWWLVDYVIFLHDANQRFSIENNQNVLVWPPTIQFHYVHYIT